MADFSISGLEELGITLKKISDIPEDVMANALTSAGKILAEEQRKVGDEKGVRDPESNVHILDKIRVNKPKVKKNKASVTITFSGKRKRGKNKIETRNAEIAFINEFGKKGVPAKEFVAVANAKAQDKAMDAAADVIRKWIESNFTE